MKNTELYENPFVEQNKPCKRVLIYQLYDQCALAHLYLAIRSISKLSDLKYPFDLDYLEKHKIAQKNNGEI